MRILLRRWPKITNLSIVLIYKKRKRIGRKQRKHWKRQRMLEGQPKRQTARNNKGKKSWRSRLKNFKRNKKAWKRLNMSYKKLRWPSNKLCNLRINKNFKNSQRLRLQLRRKLQISKKLSRKLRSKRSRQWNNLNWRKRQLNNDKKKKRSGWSKPRQLLWLLRSKNKIMQDVRISMLSTKIYR